MLIKAGDRLVPISAINHCEIRNVEVIIHTLSGDKFLASGEDAEVIKAMVARIQKPSTGKKADNVRKKEEEQH